MFPNWAKVFVGLQVILAMGAVVAGLTGLRVKQVYQERDELRASQPGLKLLQDHLNANEQQVRSLIIEQENLGREIKDTHTKISQPSAIDDLQSKISKVSMQLEGSQQTIQELQSRLNSSEQQVKSLQNQQQKFQTQLAANTNTSDWLLFPNFGTTFTLRGREHQIVFGAGGDLSSALSNFHTLQSPFDGTSFSASYSLHSIPFQLSYDASNQCSAYQQSLFPSIFDVCSPSNFGHRLEFQTHIRY